MNEKKLVDQLFFRLSEEALDALQAAVQFCKLRRNRHVELVHWLQQLLQSQDSDLHRIIQFFGIRQTAVEGELSASLNSSRAGFQGPPTISNRLRELVAAAWLQASIGHKDDKIRTGYLLLAGLVDEEFRDLVQEASATLAGISPDELAAKFDAITEGSPEATKGPRLDDASADKTLEAEGGVKPLPSSRPANSLALYTDDLTDNARKGLIHPVTGRDEEIRMLIRILLNRWQNNPILTGEAGVGKTAVVEGFALRVAAGDVPPSLKAVSVRSVDMTRLQAGAGVRGEFENRLKELVDEVKAVGNIILFIDEAHNLIGAGGAAGQGDAANILKPALARGELRTIAATTADEYRKFIEEDPALKRRFQEVVIAEPSEAATVAMLRPLAKVLEKHHGVVILAEALAGAARLSNRYLPARRLPEKAVGILDSACSLVAVSQAATPPILEDTLRSIASLKAEEDLLRREQRMGIDHGKRLAALESELRESEAHRDSLDARLKIELPLVQEIKTLRQNLQAGSVHDTEPQTVEWQKALQASESRLAEIQGDEPLSFSCVNQQAVATVLAQTTGIPVGRMAKDEIKATLTLKETLAQRVVGQDHALQTIQDQIRNSDARLTDPNRPIGSFLMVGPSGTGKTETALALAAARYGSERHLVVFNMNEFKEEHTVSSLLGAPPGYVGYQKGGLLTEAIRRRPYSVVLLDEFEKGHKSIQDVFLQVLDQGWTKDREGRFVDFRNTVLMFTSNAACDRVLELCEDAEFRPTPAALTSELKDLLRKYFSDPLLGRLTLVPYYPLDRATLESVMGIKLGRIKRRLAENHEIEMTWDASVIQHISESCTAMETGARMIDSFINNSILADISREVLSRMLDGKPLKQIAVSFKNGAFEYAFT